MLIVRTLAWLTIVAASTTPASLRAVEIPGDPANRLLNDVKFLADDAREGRGVGTSGLDAAAAFLVEQFRGMGLNVTTTAGGALQTFEITTNSRLGEKNAVTIVDPEGHRADLAINKDFEVGSYGGSGRFDAEIVFAGYGIEDKDAGYNDYADLDVKGKVVLVMRRNPGQDNPHGPFGDPHGVARSAALKTKVSQAIQHGAVAIVFVNDPFSIAKAKKERQEGIAKAQEEVASAAARFVETPAEQGDQVKEQREKLQAAVTAWKKLVDDDKTAVADRLMPFGYSGHNEGGASLPAFHITQAQADVMLKGALGKTLAELEQEIDSDFKPRSAVLKGWKLQGEISVEPVRSTVSNVIATLPGEGPLADETIVVGAHYDHVGRGGANSLSPGSTDIHNGADDNASGTAALLEVARRLAARPGSLPRRIVFIAFTGEELGLLGSARYVKEPVFPLEKTICMFNMDMVGRLKDDKLTIFGSGTSPRWEPELKQLNESTRFQLTFKPEGFGPSDHSSFYGKKIPVLHFFTGNHPDYHRPSDDWDKINVEGMARVADMLTRLVIQTAENPERPSYVEVKQAPTAQRGGNRPYFGTIPDFGGEGEGYTISGSAPGSPADKGGLKAGDRIVELGGNKITSLDDFDLALRKFKAGETVAVIVIRNDQRVELKVILDPPR